MKSSAMPLVGDWGGSCFSSFCAWGFSSEGGVVELFGGSWEGLEGFATENSSENLERSFINLSISSEFLSVPKMGFMFSVKLGFCAR